MIAGQIRMIVLGMVRNEQGEYLFDAMIDPKKDLKFLRPVGGGVEFGETSHEAIHREFKEELNAEVAQANLIDVFENIFEYNGSQGHEIVFVYDVVLATKEIYENRTNPIQEGKEQRVAEWFAADALADAVILPPQIKALIR